MRKSDPHPAIILMRAILSAAALRVFFIGRASLWLDEALNLAVTKAGQSVLWSGTLENHHPPLFYLLQAFWIHFGESEAILRILSALFGVASIPLVYLLGKKISGKNVGFSAAWLAAFSPLLIWYSREARSYGMLMFVGLAAMLAFVHLLLNPRFRQALLFIVTMTAAVYVHYGAFLLVPLQVCLLAFLKEGRASRKRAASAWILSWIAVIVAFSPWLRSPAARGFFKDLRSGSYPVQFLAARLGLEPGIVMLILAIGLALAMIACSFLLPGILRKLERARHDERIRVRLSRIFLFFYFLLLIASVLPRGYSVKKQLVVLWPYLLLFFGWIWPWDGENRKRLAALLGISLIASVATIVFVPKDQWREAVDFIHVQSQKNDIVLLLPGYGVYPFDYYDSGKTEKAGIQSATPLSSLSAIVKGHNRIWLLSNRPDVVDPEAKIRSWLEANAKLVMARDFYLVQALLYRTD